MPVFSAQSATLPRARLQSILSNKPDVFFAQAGRPNTPEANQAIYDQLFETVLGGHVVPTTPDEIGSAIVAAVTGSYLEYTHRIDNSETRSETPSVERPQKASMQWADERVFIEIPADFYEFNEIRQKRILNFDRFRIFCFTELYEKREGQPWQAAIEAHVQGYRNSLLHYNHRAHLVDQAQGALAKKGLLEAYADALEKLTGSRGNAVVADNLTRAKAMINTVS